MTAGPTTIRHGMGIARATPYGTWRAEVNAGHRRRRQTCRTLGEARAWIDATAVAVLNETAAPSAVDLRDAKQARSMLPAEVTLSDAAAFWLLHHRATTPMRWRDAIDQFLASRQAEGIRQRTLHQYRSQLRRLSGDFGDVHLHDVSVASLLAWLDHHQITGRTRANYKTAVSALYEWARARGYADVNPARGIQTTRTADESLPTVLSPDAATRMMRAAEDHDPGLIPFLALGLFAGLRTAELLRLDMSAINGQYIRVLPEVAKRRRQRYVTILPNLAAWLAAYPRTGRVAPCQEKALRRRRKAVAKHAGIAAWPSNAARHSFASYHLAMTHDAPKTAHELGHTQSDVLFAHYRNLVTAEDAAAYFAIMPRDVSRPVSRLS